MFQQISFFKFLIINLLLYMLLSVFMLKDAAALDLSEGNLDIINPVILAPTGGAKVTAGYLSIRNNGPSKITLLRVQTNLGRTMLHSTETDENGVVRMKHINKVDINPGNTFKMERGGFHIMILGMQQEIKKGDMIPATLVFSEKLRVKIKLLVE
ncbi:MAG: copper chaperone PCu(A)C [Pseudomonadota bacterium]|nr:copper chaperone PCu(A)C [Pseudomonadota bacterium]